MFTKDSRTETFLVQMGVDFNYTNSVSFDDLAADWEERNLSRPVPIREEAVLEYATLMQSGSPAPSPILWIRNDGLDVLDGVQRLAAAQLAGFTKLSAYVVTCDSYDVVTAIRVLANARLQGRPEPPEWTRKRAVEVLVVERGLSCEEVARMGGWSPSQVKATALILEWGKSIKLIGGPSVSDRMIQVLSDNTSQKEIATCPDVISKFLQSLSVAKFSSEDSKPYVKEFFSPVTKKSNRHKIYSDRLKKFLDDPEVVIRMHGRKGCGISKDVLLNRSLKTCITVLDEIISSGQTLPYIDEFFRLKKEIDKRLQKLSPNPKAVKVRVPGDMYQ